jgi:hypothetical protein
MKKLAFSLLAVVLFFSACSKDDDETVAGGSFVINGKTVATQHGFLFDYGSDGNEIIFSDAPLSDTFSGKFSAVSIDLDTLIDGGSYTYMTRDSSAYNKTKNFYDAIAIYQGNFVDGQADEATGTWLTEPKSGTVSIKKSGETYTVTYSFVFPTTTVSGKYTGALSLVD